MGSESFSLGSSSVWSAGPEVRTEPLDCVRGRDEFSFGSRVVGIRSALSRKTSFVRTSISGP